MNEKELAPISIEIATPDEVSQVGAFSKVSSSESGIGLGSKLNTVLGVAGDVLEMAEGANLYKVAVPDGYTLKDLVPSKKDAEAVRALVKDSNGKINGDVSFKLNGGQQATSPLSLCTSSSSLVLLCLLAFITFVAASNGDNKLRPRCPRFAFWIGVSFSVAKDDLEINEVGPVADAQYHMIKRHASLRCCDQPLSSDDLIPSRSSAKVISNPSAIFDIMFKEGLCSPLSIALRYPLSIPTMSANLLRVRCSFIRRDRMRSPSLLALNLPSMEKS